MTVDTVDAETFLEIEMRLNTRRLANFSNAVVEPLIRVWDKEMQLLARVVAATSWSVEELALDDGNCTIEIVGVENEWLRDIIVFNTRPAEDLHITVDFDPTNPTDYLNRWGGKVVQIDDEESNYKATTTTLKCVHNRRHLSHVMLAATPLFPPAIQPIKMFLWGGPCVTTCATSFLINLFRIYTLNGFWPLPRNLFDPTTWLSGINPLDWPVQVMPVNPILDQSRWCTIASRWKDAATIFAPVMKDAGVICHAYTWLPGDPPPYTAVFGEALGAILVPTRSCVILSFEDQSGVSGPTGTAVDGAVNLFAATGDDIISETLFPVDGNADDQTDPFIRKIFGVAPQPPPFVYRDIGYGGATSRRKSIHKSQATDIYTGGKSPQWVNQAITFAIRYGLSQLAQVINYGIGAYEQYGVEGLDNLYQGQLDDVFLAFIGYIDPGRASQVGSYAFREHFETGSGSAFTVNSVMTLREGWWKTRPYVNFTFDINDASPYALGQDIRLGSRVSVEQRGILYTDQILGILYQGNRTDTSRRQITVGDPRLNEDPFARGVTAIANVANFAAMLAGSGDMF